jgi:acyl-CoA thioester hydrolase
VLDTGGRTVPPEWIDYNGHMMDAYYFLAFTEATEAFLDHLGLGRAYHEQTGAGIYTAESHLCFRGGLAQGSPIAYRSQLLGHDAKRLHVFHELTSDDGPAATCELMFLHVSDGRVRPMPAGPLAAVTRLAARQARLPRPAAAGRRISMAQGAGRGQGYGNVG